MDRWKNKVAVVTGASSGIGSAVAQELVKHGMIVIGIARRKNLLQELSESLTGPGEFHAVQADITNEDELSAAFAFIQENFAGIHVLVNNAGIARPGLIANMDAKYIKEVLSVNVVGLTLCTQNALKIMKECEINDGHIINMNSVLGHNLNYFSDNTAMYGPSKFAVTALTEVIRRQLRNSKSKIKISNISPGHVNTDIMEVSTRAVGGKFKPELMKDAPALTALDVAAAVIYMLSTPPHVHVADIIIKPVGETF